eukprot:TRINITY_DN22944_c0_g1_i2.p1 TRINITY_DN22944_c0_g1~~TRINITY_DN22944_c0_g1_i2.p1  ORF type:complete len:310 (-),score=52.28 TRINITY_DN22944_c0_g1_i2:55-984(-)
MEASRVVLLLIVAVNITYGSLYCLEGGYVSLVQVDTETGLNSLVGLPNKNDVREADGSLLDDKSGIYYSFAVDLSIGGVRELVGISVQNGSIISRIRPTKVVQIFVSPAMIPSTGNIVAIAEASAEFSYLLILNPRTGNITHLEKLNGNSVGSKSGVYDPVHDNYWFQLQTFTNGQINNKVFAYNIGQRRFVIESAHNSSFLFGLALDSKTSTLKAVGFSQVWGTPYLLSIDMTNGNSTIISSYSQFSGVEEGCAFDPEQRIFYSYLRDVNPQRGFFLVGVNVDTGSIISQPRSGHKIPPSSCGWSSSF